MPVEAELEQARAELAALKLVIGDLIHAIDDWSRPTGANGMIPAGANHPLCQAATRARQQSSDDGPGDTK